MAEKAKEVAEKAKEVKENVGEAAEKVKETVRVRWGRRRRGWGKRRRRDISSNDVKANVQITENHANTMLLSRAKRASKICFR